MRLIILGEVLQLQTVVDGTPFPSVEWYRENSLLKRNSRTQMEVDRKSGICSLIIQSSRKVDMGEYECMAKNKAGEASTYCEVIIDQNSDSDGKVKGSKYSRKTGTLKGMSTDEASDGDAGKSAGMYNSNSRYIISTVSFTYFIS